MGNVISYSILSRLRVFLRRGASHGVQPGNKAVMLVLTHERASMRHSRVTLGNYRGNSMLVFRIRMALEAAACR